MDLRSYRYDALLWFCNYVVAAFPSARLRHVFYKKFMKVKMAKGSHICSSVWFDCRSGVSIGDNSVINQRCRLDGRGGLFIGANVSVSPDVSLITADHDMQDPLCSGRNRAVTIHEHVFIGSRAVILPGVTLHRGCVVAAGSVVTRDVEAHTIVAGVPARFIKKRMDELSYTTSGARHFI
ncbi:putative acetyltransferase [Crateriforma conspicua]|uniref:Putative acetyltransferase n=1 Tax=Crateriforma conspicua TaxID=2527996 RepID=A0A5C6FDQ0_9PLAN|nr:putative acetyltransferase [Crateriforma conspicua]